MSEVQSATDAPAIPSPASGPATAEPRGIGGWLVIVALGQVVGPFRLVAQLVSEYPQYRDLLGQVPVAGYGELALNLVLLVFMLISAVLFFRTSRHFPRVFIYQQVVLVAFPILTSAWLALALSFQFDEPFGDHFLFEAEDVAQVGLAAIMALIWIPYILRSKRVRNTFIAPTVVAAKTANWLLQLVVYFFVASGLFGLLAGLGHMLGRGLVSGQLIGGAIQIALAIWLFRGSNIARALLACMSLLSVVMFVAFIFLYPDREASLLLWSATAAASAVAFWVLVFSKRFRAELARNAEKYKDPELAIEAGER